MRLKGAINVGGTAFGVAILGMSGYMLGESMNDTSPRTVEARVSSLDSASIGYIAVGGEGTCEADVLSVMLNIHAVNTPASASLTEQALDNVCGIDPEHEAVANTAKKKFEKVTAARDKLAQARDSSEYDLSEEVVCVAAATVGGVLTGFGAVVGTDVIRHRMRRRRRA